MRACVLWYSNVYVCVCVRFCPPSLPQHLGISFLHCLSDGAVQAVASRCKRIRRLGMQTPPSVTDEWEQISLIYCSGEADPLRCSTLHRGSKCETRLNVSHTHMEMGVLRAISLSLTHSLTHAYTHTRIHT